MAVIVQNQHKRKEKAISLDIPNAPSPVAKRASRYATRRSTQDGTPIATELDMTAEVELDTSYVDNSQTNHPAKPSSPRKDWWGSEMVHIASWNIEGIDVEKLEVLAATINRETKIICL